MLNVRILILILISNWTILSEAYVFDEGKPPQYQFVDDGSYVDRLIYTSELITFLTQKYGSLVKHSNQHVDLSWNYDWAQNYIGAGSKVYEGKFSVMLYGGYVRAKGSTFELIAVTLCHEIGHYVGGSPRQRLTDKNVEEWSSSEGQSDWFAAKDCLPLVFQEFKKTRPERLTIQLTSSEKAICLNELSAQSSEQCQWIMSAGLNFARFARHYSESETPQLFLEKSATERPDTTLHSRYPTLQCRLDTYRQGALCAQVSKTHFFCQRPRCWYNPDQLF